MKKFGFSKKGSDAGEDTNRLALFGSRSKSTSPGPKSSNPYAQPSSTAPKSSNPYAQPSNSASPDPYARPAPRPSNSYGGMSQPSAGSGRSPGPYAAAPPPYQEGSADMQGGPIPNEKGGYGPSRGGYGSNGYGDDRYGSPANNLDPSAASASRYGPGGYGGLGRSNSYDTTTTEDNREALFGGARERQQQQQQRNQQPPENGQPDGGYEAGNGYDAPSGTSGGQNQGYSAYGDRQLTAEEEEEEDVQATKQQIRFMKQEDVSSTRNALRIAAQAEETGRNTLQRLGAQGERIHNTERNLDLAANQNRIAEAKARELKTLNKSMFAVHVNNPFTGSSRRRQRDEDIINKHRNEREVRDNTRAAAFESKMRQEQFARELRPGEPGYQKNKGKATLAERSKYQFEADSSDDEKEEEIERNLDMLGKSVNGMNYVAKAINKEVDEQNVHISRITGKSDRVDDQIAMNRARLDRIK
ncbi:MAG: hypothetical protein M1819_002527 [Sarea resinae]|nr:MAG: hypothetical protein M1819_002527 [Sarea resinae]